MALDFKYTVTPTSDGKGIIYTNTTGAYSPTNTGGAGSPNPSISDIIVCTADIYIPDPTTYQVTSTFVTVDLYALGFPSTTSVVVPNTALGLSSTVTLPDGWYTSDLTVSGTDSETDEPFADTTEVDFVLYHNTRCCIDAAISAKITDCGCTKMSALQIEDLESRCGT